MTKALSGFDMIEAAATIARQAHEGQTDKAGLPYILHPQMVANRCLYNYGPDVHLIAAAWLHDVVEDSEWTIEALREKGFSPECLKAVEAVTRRDGEDYLGEFIPRVIASGERAVRLKRADLSHNTSPSRRSSLSQSHARRYATADAMLAPHEGRRKKR